MTWGHVEWCDLSRASALKFSINFDHYHGLDTWRDPTRCGPELPLFTLQARIIFLSQREHVAWFYWLGLWGQDFPSIFPLDFSLGKFPNSFPSVWSPMAFGVRGLLLLARAMGGGLFFWNFPNLGEKEKFLSHFRPLMPPGHVAWSH